MSRLLVCGCTCWWWWWWHGAGAGASARDKSLDDLVRVERATELDEGNDDHQGNDSEHDQTAFDGVAGRELAPRAAGVADVFLDLVGSELVVDQPAEGDGVAEQLERGHGGFPVDGGDGDEDDILEHTAEGEDQRRGFPNLYMFG